jgi:hypothetical protein
MKSEFKRLWIGQAEIAIADRSISQCLEEMSQQGWILITARARADLQGIVCEYDFERPFCVVEQYQAGHTAKAQQSVN